MESFTTFLMELQLMDFPMTLRQAADYFKTKSARCRRAWIKFHWPLDQITCPPPDCGAPAEWPDSPRRPHCRTCRRRFNERTGTVAQGSVASAAAWWTVVWA